MNDTVFIPRHLAKLLFDELVSWEAVESIVTLLTIASIREPLEVEDHYYKYVVKSSEVRTRVTPSICWDQHYFQFGARDIPYITKFTTQGPRDSFYCYQVHELVHPKNYKFRHKRIPSLNFFPIDLWKIPRHVLIRWRYAAKLPIHKSNFAEKEVLKDARIAKKACLSLSNAISTFQMISKSFKTLMCACDVSTVGFSFICHVYFFAHDGLIQCMRNQTDKENFFLFLERLEACFRNVSFLDAPVSRKLLKLEGLIRSVLPAGFFNRHPFSLFSTHNFTRSR